MSRCARHSPARLACRPGRISQALCDIFSCGVAGENSLDEAEPALLLRGELGVGSDLVPLNPRSSATPVIDTASSVSRCPVPVAKTGAVEGAVWVGAAGHRNWP